MKIFFVKNPQKIVIIPVWDKFSFLKKIIIFMFYHVLFLNFQKLYGIPIQQHDNERIQIRIRNPASWCRTS